MCLFLFRLIDSFSAVLTHVIRERLRRITCNDIQSCVIGFVITIMELCLVVVVTVAASCLVGASVAAMAAAKLVFGVALKWHTSLAGYFGTIYRGLRACQAPTTPVGSVDVGVHMPIEAGATARRVPMAVPVGAAAGATLRFRHPDGSVYTVPVPMGVPAGRTFWATLPVAVPVVGSAAGRGGSVDVAATVEATLRRLCAACIAEVYCCCMPFYLLSLLLAPLAMGLSLGCAAVSALCRGVNAGCMPLRRLAEDWWPSVLIILHDYDRTSSAIAFGDPARFRVGACAFQTEAVSEAIVVMGEPVDPADWSTPDVVLVEPLAGPKVGPKGDSPAVMV